ncbi:TetR family transcriptional regulator [Curtobacterium sp. 'Ferrero']|uniref:TetR/AcrR family transcriptional regulator n=1 Tax=Curtobacterium sp. 'Ferrero' TaxID=2033654 RepID=UPI000BCAA381|nr:TetR/AcrR family transcriptional regulator [Curtobacterium sp. 'Ferrero']PCN47615.1 TetR family transcriptional regulator [Curtobacterium sp. 'Ferrero']
MTGPTAPDTRSRILIAAATMLGEDPTARLTVRAVAARAGVSTGSLRHFFPTQQQLLDTVVAGLETLEVPDDPMADTSRPAADRLVDCLHLLLASTGRGAEARRRWTALHDAHIAASAPEDSGDTFLAMERLGVGRVRAWLDALRHEGVVLHGDPDQAARFLLTVVDGLALGRALPGAGARIPSEPAMLRLAVDAVLRQDAPRA